MNFINSQENNATGRHGRCGSGVLGWDAYTPLWCIPQSISLVSSGVSVVFLIYFALIKHALPPTQRDPPPLFPSTSTWCRFFDSSSRALRKKKQCITIKMIIVLLVLQMFKSNGKKFRFKICFKNLIWLQNLNIFFFFCLHKMLATFS